MNISSMSGHEPHTNMGAYSASKSGLNILTKQMALEWVGYNIRVNAVSPGMIRTPLSEVVYQDEDIHNRRKEIVPVNRIGVGQDIADAVIFLSSAKSSYITGQALVVDGGLTETILNYIPGRPGKK